jgi:hypothetical protein
MSYDERMAAILLSDAQRRMTLEGITLRDVYDAINAVYWHHRGITGVPAEPNRMHRASEDCWEVSLRKARALNTPDAVREARTQRRTDVSRATRVQRDIARQADMGTIHTAE